MLVRAARLFAVAVALALLVVCALSVRLLGRRPEVLKSEAVQQQLHRRPLQLARVVANLGKNPGNSSKSLFGGSNSSVFVRPHSSTEEPAVFSPLTNSSSSATSSVHTLSLNQTIGTFLSSVSSSTHQLTEPHPTNKSLPLNTETNTSPPTQLPKTSHPHSTAALTTLQTSSTTEVSPEARGYVLAENYYEQQTMGLRNMMQLQCWAQSLKLKVVKPVTHDSFLRTPLDTAQQASFLRFEDSFDEEGWAHHAERLGYAPLVPWSEFLSRAPRDVVVVQFEHPSVSMVKARQRTGQGILHSPASPRYTSGCSSKWPTTRDLLFLRSNRFRIVRKVCFNFYFGDQLSLETFNKHLLEDLPPSSVTIVMETWRGISSAQRVLLRDVCQNTALVQEHLSLGPRLAQQAEQYIHKNLGGSRRYLAIMARLEISQLTVHKKVPVVPFCLEETLAQWRHFKTDSRLEKTFLSIDIGRYGSKKYRSGLQPEIEMAFHKFFQTLFGMSATVKEWEKGFELVAGTRDAGYIGLLQKMLVTRAECVLFVGGGAFQRHALYLYKQLHPDPRDQCYRIVKQCTRSNKLS